MSQPEELRRYLAERDVPCPGCGYNLRGLGENCCPECGRELSYRELSRERPRGLIDTVSVGVDLLRYGLLLLISVPIAIALIATGLFRSGPLERRVALVVAGLAAICMVIGSWPILRAPKSPWGNVQRKSVVLFAIGLLTLLALVWRGL